MFNLFKNTQIKSFVLLGLLMASILFVKMTPVEIIYSDAVKEAHYQSN